MKVLVFGVNGKSEVQDVSNSEKAILALLGGKGTGRVMPEVGQDLKFFVKSADLLENGTGEDDIIVVAALTESGQGYQSLKTWQVGRAVRTVRALRKKKASPAPKQGKTGRKRRAADDTAE